MAFLRDRNEAVEAEQYHLLQHRGYILGGLELGRRILFDQHRALLWQHHVRTASKNRFPADQT